MKSLAGYLEQPATRQRLEARTCVERKPWYAFHETPPLAELLQPKLVCKDIAKEPWFWVDEGGDIVPLHSTYYIVPATTALLRPLAEYLNSQPVRAWLSANSQRAANGYVRMQSTVLKRLPVGDHLAGMLQQRRLAA
jgi:adenine-specific DNA-methyltransferase